MGFSKYIYQNDLTSENMYFHKIKQSWTGKKCTHSVFLDVESAFDKIWHKAMVAKLNSIGIEGKLWADKNKIDKIVYYHFLNQADKNKIDKIQYNAS